MNERIKELAVEAGIITEVWKTDSLGHGYKVPNYEAEKFAELIVKVCILEIGYKSVELLDIDFYPHYQERLKKYFGVEE